MDLIQKVCRLKSPQNVDFAGETSLYVDSVNWKADSYACATALKGTVVAVGVATSVASWEAKIVAKA